MVSLCLMVRFKNERHIMYEFIHHYLEEGVDHFLLLDDHSNDDYLEVNKEWLQPLLDNNVIMIKKTTLPQREEYNLHIEYLKLYDWAMCVDMDEFVYSVKSDTTIKSLLCDHYNTYDRIFLIWRVFTHKCENQPVSVIEDNIITHSSCKDLKTHDGKKNIFKTENVKSIDIHDVNFNKTDKTLGINNCHSGIIRNNHYRTQSDEYLYKVKKFRGGGVDKRKYKFYSSHKESYLNMECKSLYEKRKGLIEKLHNRQQIKPKSMDPNDCT